jgi:hypothetical protein
MLLDWNSTRRLSPGMITHLLYNAYPHEDRNIVDQSVANRQELRPWEFLPPARPHQFHANETQQQQKHGLFP